MFVRTVCVFLFVLCVPTLFAGAQETGSSVTTLAGPVEIVDEARNGDIVSYVGERDSYVLTYKKGDAQMFGVVVDDPVFYLRNETVASSTYPVVSFGEAIVNVSSLGGDIRAGDLVTSSPIVGVGQRVDQEYVGFVLGFALGDAIFGAEEIMVDEEQVRLGTVPVTLRIGPHVQGSQMGDSAADLAVLRAQMEKLQVQEAGGDGEKGGFDTFLLIRYVLGAFVALAAIVLALRRFGDLFAQSIISVGRNPLARTQIRGILIWNAVLIMIVSGIGFGIGIAIIIL